MQSARFFSLGCIICFYFCLFQLSVFVFVVHLSGGNKLKQTFLWMSKELSNARAGLESRATYTNIIFFQKDLPEIPELDITIDDDVQLVELGVIFSIVESMGKNISYVRLPNHISIPASCCPENYFLFVTKLLVWLCANDQKWQHHSIKGSFGNDHLIIIKLV